MPERIHYIPAAGLRVVDPHDGQPLPPEGKAVAEGNEIYWLRRVREGDVVEGLGPRLPTEHPNTEGKPALKSGKKDSA